KQGDVVFMNTAGAELFDMDKTQMIGKTQKELFPPGVAKAHLEETKDVFAGKTIRKLENFGTDENPTWVDVSLIPIKNENGEIIYIHGSGRNITSNYSHYLLLNATLRSIGDGIIATDEKGLVTLLNPVAEKLTGWTNNEALGKEISEIFKIINDFTREEVINPVHRVLKEGIIVGLANHTILISKDGTERPISDSGAPIRMSSQDKVQGAILVFRDVSEEYERKKRLVESEERFELAVRGSQDGIWDWNIRTNELYLSPKWKEQVGYADDELKNHFDTFANLLHPDDFKHVLGQVQKYFEGKTDKYEMEFRLKHKDGGYRWIWARGEALRDESGQAYRMAGSHTDITLKKQQEKTTAIMASIIEQTSDVCVVKDTNLKVIAANKSAVEMAKKKSANELLHKTDCEIFNVGPDHPQVQKGEKADRETQLLPKGEHRLTEETLNFSEHEVRYFHTKRFPIYNNDELLGTAMIETDITDLKKLEIEKQKTTNKLIHSSKLASIGTLAAGVAHEINNPLSIVAGYTDLLASEKLMQDESIKEKIEQIQIATKRIADIVNSLRTYARADTDHIETVDIHQCIEETLALIKSIYEKENITIETELSATDYCIKGNIGKIQQIFMNFLNNAKDAVEKVSKGIIKIATRNDFEKIKIIISDNGQGIPKQVIEKLFDPFFTTKPPGKGTGLGLSISYTIIESMKGDIDIETEEGLGTTFTISFDLNEVKMTETPQIDNPSEELFSGKALIIDDEVGIRKILCEFLKQLGLTVFEAEDGKQALELISNHETYDYIFTDIKMPHINGDELLAIAKEKNLTPNSKFIIMTGGILTDYTQEQRQKLRSDAQGYLRKPFILKDVVSVLKDLKI
ncbi:MAG: PAS domain S-box protein, partial [Bacteriovoracia bacterium]